MNEGGVGQLVVVATPIGNLDDLSPRAVAALASADVVAAEDTRRTGRLLAHAGLDRPLLSYHEHNEARRAVHLLDRVAAGETVALVTDAGTPGVSDPGQRAVREAVDRGLRVEAVPGPVAAVHALVLSGLATDRFAVEGFLPRKAGERGRRLAELADDRRTLVFYVAPHRAAADLAAMAEAFGSERSAALARELTKLHEEVWRGSLSELAERAEAGLKGEVTVVVAGAPEPGGEDVSDDDLVARVRELVATGTTKKDAIAEVARAASVPKRRVYQAVLDRG
ncbi:16S rRNA (cytidine(1402)-2'-O)-methyltransferase [Egibacter rhizosphaerae]|uniref:Ribosomal RNA small subunit methyltransferase I n=1 Tax=Egibacter rhizosphaerae TaxID=1670831 RepID=A0A411YLL2_9ACTN|nr:16S rRNA (cytidine(1402)-2'-O)-methyltransferase [Egibacter rhizosphaerae]